MTISTLYKYLFLLFFSISACEAQQPNNKPYLAKPSEIDGYTQILEGKWQSLDDSNSVVTIDKEYYHDSYENEKLSVAAYTLTTNCPQGESNLNSDGKKNILVVYRNGDEPPFCYGIYLLTDKNLTLIYIGRRNSLKFKRIK